NEGPRPAHAAAAMDLVRRRLRRDELPLAWTIDRREIVERVFDLRDGQLVSRPDRFDIRGWPPGDAEKLTPIFEATLDRGGAFLGVFDGEHLVALAVVDTLPLGRSHDLRQLTFLHVGRDYRRLGAGGGIEAHEAQRHTNAPRLVERIGESDELRLDPGPADECNANRQGADVPGRDRDVGVPGDRGRARRADEQREIATQVAV